MGGGCTPTIDIYEDYNSTAPNGGLYGPICFGGCLELCCEGKFIYKAKDGRQIGRMRKLTPQSCGDCCKEICTDSDKYKIEFYEGSTAEEKANTIALTLLADYMFFERDQGIITCVQEEGQMVLKFTCCLTWCCGCIFPCTGTIKPQNAQGGGGPVGAEGEWEPEDEWLRNYVRNVKMNRD